MYQVEFAEDEVTELTTNDIAELMDAQCNADGNEYLLLDVLVDYCKNIKAISRTNQQTMVWGRSVTHKIIAELKICSHWMDGFTSWEKLSELKKSHPVQTAKCAIMQEIDYEPAFNCWVKHVLKKRNRVITSNRRSQTRYLKKSYKFGIELLKTVDHAPAMDSENGGQQCIRNHTRWKVSAHWPLICAIPYGV